MKRITSVILAVIMVLTASPFVFANGSEAEYNSLRLPVVNEIKEKRVAESSSQIGEYYADIADAVVVPESGGNSGGSAGNGGIIEDSTGDVTTEPVEPAEFEDGVIRATIDCPSEEPVHKGYDFTIIDIAQYLEPSVMLCVDHFLERYDMGVTYLTFEKDGEKQDFFCDSRGAISWADGRWDLLVPVPYELENGEYNVEARFITLMGRYTDAIYNEIVLTFPLEVEAPPENITEGPYYFLNKTEKFKESEVAILESSYEEVRFNFENVFLTDPTISYTMPAFLINEDGNFLHVRAGAWDDVVNIYNSNKIPQGKYDCYFYMTDEDTG